ncbi:MAG: ATP-dependent protease ATPase subunit HslU [Fusobacteriaceae bacterium]
MRKDLTAKKIVEELDKYIVSQDEAKKSVAISLRNRYRRKLVQEDELRKEITPKNIILIGSTGVGKTEIARRIAKIVDAPFIKVEATKYTEVGYVGKDVESIIRDLVSIAYKKIEAQMLSETKTEVQEIAIEKVALIIKSENKNQNKNLDKNSAKNKKNLKPTAEELKKIIEEIKSGKFDDKIVDISEEENLSEMENNFYGGDIGDMEDFNDVFLGIIGRNNDKKISVKDAIEKIKIQEARILLNRSNIKDLAIKKVEEDGIVFLDEIDKITEGDSGGRSESVSRQGVQRDILPIVEGCIVQTKYGDVNTDHILFIAAGAFSQSSPSDIMPELQGRFPVSVRLENLTKEDLIRILSEVKFNMLKQYQALLEEDEVTLKFTKDGIEMIADMAVKLNSKVENIGARRLHTVLETVLRDIMYEAPYKNKKEITINKDYVIKTYKGEIFEEDLNKYIL